MRNLVLGALLGLLIISFCIGRQSPKPAPTDPPKAQAPIPPSELQSGGYIPITTPPTPNAGIEGKNLLPRPPREMRHLVYHPNEMIEFVNDDPAKRALFHLEQPLSSQDTPVIFGAYLKVANVNGGQPWTSLAVTTPDLHPSAEYLRWHTTQKLETGSYYFVICVSRGNPAHGSATVESQVFNVDVK